MDQIVSACSYPTSTAAEALVEVARATAGCGSHTSVDPHERVPTFTWTDVVACNRWAAHPK
eukprot:349770-Chlamydomonas_euryale.AAC.3